MMTQSRAKIRVFLTLLAVLGILSFIYNVPSAMADFSAAKLKLKTGTLTANGTVFAMALGANGTLYIGGTFTTVGSSTRNHLAAIGTDGTLTSWNPNANSTGVNALAISGSTVYAGGTFTTVGSSTRNHLAAIGTDGTLTSWDPNVDNGTVDALAISGFTVYAGGSFSGLGGTTRNRLAAIGTDGALTSWNPNVSGTVNALAISGSTIYAGGNFSTIGGTTRNNLAAIGTDGTLTSWDPNANSLSAVKALAISGSTVYAGGSFSTIGGTTRSRLAAIGTDGTLTSWNPNANNTVNALAISGSTVYAGGSFTAVGGNTNIIRFAQFIVPQRNSGRAASIARAFPLPTIATFFSPQVNPDLASAISIAASTTATSTSSTTSLRTPPVLPPYPTIAQVQTAISELIKLINQIQDNLQAPDVLTLIAQIAQQIARIQQAIGTPPATLFPVEAVPKTGSYQKQLSFKQRNDDVRALQTFLKSQGADIYPEGLVTGYFGPLTKEAAGRFQLKYGLVHDKDDPAYGYLGPKTRAKINFLLGL